jgi:hypothetical protein
MILCRYCIASLNLLGDGLNPVEFLPLNDPTFMSQYAEVEKLAFSLSHDSLRPYLRVLTRAAENGVGMARANMREALLTFAR